MSYGTGGSCCRAMGDRKGARGAETEWEWENRGWENRR